MKLQLLTFLPFCGAVTACKKNNSVIDPATLPVAGFSLINGDTDGHVITIATYDQYSLKDNSTNAASWHWNFGNDSAGGTYLLSSSYEYFFSAQTGSISWPVADLKKDVFIMGM